MLTIVKELFEELNKNNVIYVHFKSNEHLDLSLEGDTDFDLLIARDSSAVYEQCLMSMGFKRFNSQDYGRYPGVDDWLGFDFDTGKLIHLHTHYQLVTGLSGFKNVVLPWSNLALKNGIVDDEMGVRIVCPEFELIELYTRIISKMGPIKNIKAYWKGFQLSSTDAREAAWLRERINSEKFSNILGLCFGESKGSTISPFMSDDVSASDAKILINDVNRVLSWNHRECGRFLSWRSYLHKKIGRVTRFAKSRFFVPWIFAKKTPHCGGLMIVFVGVDGSGKTTVSDEIAKWLSWKLETSRIGLGFGRFKKGYKYKLKQKIKKILWKRKSSSKVEGHDSKFVSSDIPIEVSLKNRRKQKKWVKFSKDINRDIRRIHSYCLSGGVAVIDRYPQLAFRGLSDGPKVNCAFPELVKAEYRNLSIVNDIQPDIVFKLIVPVELSKKRRPEDSLEVLQKKYEIISSLNYPKSKIVEIDATQPLEEEIKEIKRAIWDML